MGRVGLVFFVVVEKSAVGAKLTHRGEKEASFLFEDTDGQLAPRDLLFENGASVVGQGGL